MNTIVKKLLIFLMTIMFCQFQLINLKADDTTNIDDEELPAIDPFAGGVGSTNQAAETDNSQINSNSGLLNNLRLVGTIIGEYKKIFGIKAGVLIDQFSYSIPNDFIK